RRACIGGGSIVAELSAGAMDALSWSRAHGLRVVLVSNTLWSAAEDMAADLPALGLDGLVDGVVTSHTVGYRKPHRAIFERALAIARVAPRTAAMAADR